MTRSIIVLMCTDIQEQVRKNPNKSGIAIICVSTGYPDSKDFIANCTAMEKLRICFKEKFGYLTIQLGMNATSHQLNLTLDQVERLELPESYCRVVFYFFGHGNENSVKFADRFVKREYIVSKFQAICPNEDSNVYKIFFFDSCRTETRYHEALAGGESEGQYPASKNTIVINATERNCNAFYLVEKGCGLMTHFFAELAPTRNESLYVLLVAVRKEIYDFEKSIGNPQDKHQMLAYNDNLMGVVNFLAESRGDGKY